MIAVNTKVPFLDLAAQYKAIKPEIASAIDDVLESSAYILGPAVERFEESFARYCETDCCVALGSGTDALHIALLALGIGGGDEVITQANTFIATVEAIEYTGARPVLVDVIPDTYAIDVEAVKRAVTSKTKAVIPVHLYGQPQDLEALEQFCDARGIAVLEDASQAHGARYAGKRVGSRNVVTFSFYPGKNLGAYGEGGAVVTSDKTLARRMKMLRNHGSDERYVHEAVGYNYRMDGVQGAVLNVKLQYLDRWNVARRKVASWYDAGLEGVRKPLVDAKTEHVYHIYPIFVHDRLGLRKEMADNQIETNIHYPIPCHLQPGYKHLGYTAGDFAISEALAASELSLPMYPELSEEMVVHVCKTILEAKDKV